MGERSVANGNTADRAMILDTSIIPSELSRPWNLRTLAIASALIEGVIADRRIETQSDEIHAGKWTGYVPVVRLNSIRRANETNGTDEVLNVIAEARARLDRTILEGDLGEFRWSAEGHLNLLSDSFRRAK